MKVAIVHDRIGERSRPDERDALAQAELVADALGAGGHAVRTLEAGLDLEALRSALRELAPDLVFNLVESLGGSGRHLHFVPGLLEELGLPFTGASSEALYLTTHKLLAKRLLAAAGLPTPPLAPAAGHTGRYIVKPVWEDASVGIDDAAVVGAEEVCRALRSRGRGGPVFAEAYVEGREFNLSLLAGPASFDVLPPAEILFQDWPPDRPRIVGYAAKWCEGSFESDHTRRRFGFGPEDAPLLARLEELTRASAGVFGLQGYARVDFRVDAEGAPWILEVNANPCLSPDAGFLAAAERARLGAREVVRRICAAALAR